MTGSEGIERCRGASAGRNAGTAFGPFVWAVATAAAEGRGMAEQTRLTLGRIDEVLEALGADRARILTATVYVSDIRLKDEMDAVWCAWIGADPAHWPQRACIETGLGPATLIEIVVLAARRDRSPTP